MKKRTIAFLMVFLFMFSNLSFAYQNSAYYSDIKIGITRMASASVMATLVGQYTVDNIVYPSGTSFQLSYSGGQISLNGRLYSEISFVPSARSNSVTLSANGDVYGYANTITFKVDSGRILPINTLNIEEYLKGVVGHEMPPSYPIEALKAQAVAARTYALANINKFQSRGYNLDDTTNSQVYYGTEYSYDSSYSSRINDAVEQTKGVVLTQNGNLIATYYSASNGGYTEKSGNVWLTDLPYLDSKPDVYNNKPMDGLSTDKNYIWTQDYSISEIDGLMKDKGYIPLANYSGNWSDVADSGFSKGVAKQSVVADSYVDFTFYGTGVKWIGTSNDSMGIAEVTLDGAAQDVDVYSLSPQYQRVLFQKSGLSNVKHTLRIRVKGTKSADSNGVGINIDGFEVTANSTSSTDTDGSTQNTTVRYQESSSSFYAIDLGAMTTYVSGRVSNITIKSRDNFGTDYACSFSKEGARIFLNTSSKYLKSSLYTVSVIDNGYRFDGKGYGHGIGMSQVGAKNRAVEGQNYAGILGFYYPNTNLETMAPFLPVITGVTVNPSTILAGLTSITATTYASIGDSSLILYKYEAYKDGQLVASRDFSTDASFKFVPGSQGSYVIKSYVKNKMSSQSYDDVRETTVAVQPEPDSWSGNGIAVQRTAGQDRYETAINLSKSGWAGGSRYVVLATGEDYPDALASAPLAKTLDAPILLTYKSTLDGRVANEIKRLGAKDVYIIGSEGAIVKEVEYQLKEAGVVNVYRLAGRDRYETSVRIAEEIARIKGRVSEVAVVTGKDFPDAISIAPFAASRGIPILLTYDTAVPPGVSSFIQTKKVSKTYVVGSTGAVSESVKQQFPGSERLAGTDRFETNYFVINRFISGTVINKAYVVTGKNYPDAITVSALAARTSSPVILSDDSIMISSARSLIQSRLSTIKDIGLVGSSGIVPASTLDGIAK